MWVEGQGLKVWRLRRNRRPVVVPVVVEVGKHARHAQPRAPPGFRFRVSGLVFRVSGFGFRISVFGFQVLGFGFRVSGLGWVCFWSKVSGFGLRD